MYSMQILQGSTIFFPSLQFVRQLIESSHKHFMIPMIIQIDDTVNEKVLLKNEK